MDVEERWVRHLRATGRRPNTIVSYRSDVCSLRDFVRGADLTTIAGDDIEQFFDEAVKSGLSQGTITRRFRSIGRFYSWLDRKREIDSNPMDGRVLPKADSEQEPLTGAELAALLGACADVSSKRRGGAASSFDSLRDTALVLLLITTGLTVSDLLRMVVDDVAPGAESIRVTGSDGTSRSIPLLKLAGGAVEKYLDARAGHSRASESVAFWLGERGQLTRSGVRQMLSRRSEGAAIRCVSAHDFRR